MREVALSNGGFTKIDDGDWERVTDCGLWTRWNAGNKTYAKRDYKQSGRRWTILLHRFIMKVDHLPGKSAPIDHRDHDGLNNQKENLIDATKSSNGLNRQGLQSNNKSGVNGIYWSSQKRKWHAEICIMGRKIHVGFFTDLEEAKVARKVKEIELCQ